MKKAIAFVLTLSIILLSGCQMMGKTSSGSSSKSDPVISLDNPNIYSLDFKSLYTKICTQVDAQDDQICGYFVDDTRPMTGILFSPDGNITGIDFCLYAKKKGSTDMGYKVGTYWIEGEAVSFSPDAFLSSQAITQLQVRQRDLYKYSVDVFQHDNFDEFKKFMEWMNAFNLQTIIKQYTIGNPERYLFSTKKIKSDIIKNPDINIVYLDCSSSGIKEVDKKDIVPLGMEHGQHLAYLELSKEYCVIEPYYEQDGNLKGLAEGEMGQGENRKNFIINNLIILMFDRISFSGYVDSSSKVG